MTPRRQPWRQNINTSAVPWKPVSYTHLGTFTNTERRVQRVRKAITVPGEMRLDTDIIIDLMNRMGYPQPHLTAAEIMDEIASVTPSFGGISHARLDREEVGGKGLQLSLIHIFLPGTVCRRQPWISRNGWFRESRRPCGPTA